MRCQNGISKDEGTDERFDKVFQYIEDHAESEQKIFFDGQIDEARAERALNKLIDEYDDMVKVYESRRAGGDK